jgi:hypothetical protein
MGVDVAVVLRLLQLQLLLLLLHPLLLLPVSCCVTGA